MDLYLSDFTDPAFIEGRKLGVEVFAALGFDIADALGPDGVYSADEGFANAPALAAALTDVMSGPLETIAKHVAGLAVELAIIASEAVVDIATAAGREAAEVIAERVESAQGRLRECTRRGERANCPLPFAGMRELQRWMLATPEEVGLPNPEGRAEVGLLLYLDEGGKRITLLVDAQIVHDLNDAQAKAASGGIVAGGFEAQEGEWLVREGWPDEWKGAAN